MRNHFLAAIGVSLLVLLSLRAARDPRRADPAEQFRREQPRALAAAGRGVVLRGVADILAHAGEDSSLADQALLGDTVKVLGISGAGFVEVETGASYRGHMRAGDLVPLPPGAPPYAGEHAARVASRFANLYGRPDVTVHSPLLVAPLGSRLRLDHEHDARWLAVLLPDGRRAFVQRGDTSPPGSSFTATCVTDQALRHEGTPYLWGGRSTFGIDCSGLVSNSFIACGVTPPRDADQQYEWSALVPVERPALRPGDLLFFGERREPRPRVTHVGIYLGDDRFVHATTTARPTVHISTLSDAAWQQILVGMRHHPGLLY